MKCLQPTLQLRCSDNQKKRPDKTLSGSIITESIGAGLSTVIPVLGNYGKGKVSSYALYRLIKENPGYDVVIYPQYETKRKVIPIFYSKITVRVTARLGNIK